MIVALAVFGLAGCEDVNEITIYDPEDTGGAAPVITSVSPANAAFAGFGTITINGSNFSSVQGDNAVYFDGVRATIVTESATSITVVSPNYPKDGVALRVSTNNSVAYSAPVTYNLQPLFFLEPAFEGFEVPYSVSVDKDDNLYYTFTSNNANRGINVFGTDGSKSVYSSAVNFFNWSGFKVGPNGHVYLARRIRALFRSEPGGRDVVWAQLPNGTLVDFDFDDNGFAWAAGNRLARITMSNNAISQITPFDAVINSVRYYNGHLYLAGSKGSDQVVLRYSVSSSGTLGPEEVYYNLTQSMPATAGRSILSMAIAADGTIYLGLDSINNPIYTVGTDKVAEILYPGVLTGPISQMTWRSDVFMYAVRSATLDLTTDIKGAILKINMGKNSAPYYGHQ
jgi:hypothetical protein